jgi:hypothetical protein
MNESARSRCRRCSPKRPSVAKAAPAGAVRAGSDTGGLVVRPHGPTWNLVFRFSPVTYPVLVCTDELSEHAWRIDQDPD